jgi:hypothetical protein
VKGGLGSLYKQTTEYETGDLAFSFDEMKEISLWRLDIYYYYYYLFISVDPCWYNHWI